MGATIATALAIAAPAATASTAPLNAPANGAPPVGHVWVIMLENHSYAENFGPLARSAQVGPSGFGMRYLASTLPSQGAVLNNYFGIAHPSESNYTALVSGQPPNVGSVKSGSGPCPITSFGPLSACAGTQLDCPYFTPFTNNGGAPSFTDLGVAVGQGCVFPTSVPDVGTQMADATPALNVKAYVEDMQVPCRHPGVSDYDPAGDNTSPAYEVGDNPFLYFSNWINNPRFCMAHDVSLDRNSFQSLRSDLANAASTPNLSFIQPDLCDMGHDYCPGFGAPGSATRTSDASFFNGAAICQGAQPQSEYCDEQASAYLSWIIPIITASPAYKQDGLIAVVWDEANFYNSSPYNDYTACCNEANEAGASGTVGVTGFPLGIPITPGLIPAMIGGDGGDGGGVDIAAFLKYVVNPFGNSDDPSLLGYPGGGDSGAVLLSPFIKGGTTTNAYYNHYSLLRTIQDIFSLPHTGNAADPKQVSIGSNVFNKVIAVAARAPANTLGLVAPHSGTGRLEVRRIRRHVGDALVLQTRCVGARACTGTVTLTVPHRGRRTVVLGRRLSFVQLGDRTRDLTVYLSTRGLSYLHKHRRSKIVVTTVNDARRGPKLRWQRTFSLSLARRHYVAVRRISNLRAPGVKR